MSEPRVEKFNAGRCDVRIILNDNSLSPKVFYKHFTGHEKPYQYYTVGFLTNKMYYQPIINGPIALELARNYIMELPEKKVTILDNQMIRYEDIKTAEIINIRDYFVDVKLIKE